MGKDLSFFQGKDRKAATIGKKYLGNLINKTVMGM